jgi:hypothetical protein
VQASSTFEAIYLDCDEENEAFQTFFQCLSWIRIMFFAHDKINDVHVYVCMRVCVTGGASLGHGVCLLLQSLSPQCDKNTGSFASTPCKNRDVHMVQFSAVNLSIYAFYAFYA